MVLRGLVRVAGALALAACLWAPGPAQTPEGLVYDELLHTLPAGASPPPPGALADELATPAPGAPRPRRASRPAFRHLRYSYWNGWERVDDVTAGTATIRKCDLGQVVHLNLERKTYVTLTPDQDTPTPPPATGQATALLDETTVPLATTLFQGETANGFSTATVVTVSGPTGSCRAGTQEIHTVQYLAQRPRPFGAGCPIRDPAPENAVAYVTNAEGGCRLTPTARKAGPVVPNRLSFYSLVSVEGGPSYLTERGNIQTLTQADASRFEIPLGFTKAP